jgi:hypothetical protein
MPRKSTYRHVASSIASLTITVTASEEVSAASMAGEGSGTLAAGEDSGTFTAGEGSGTKVITTSCSPDGGGGAESSSEGTMTTSAPPEPAPTSGSSDAWAVVISTAARSSSTAAAVAGRGSTPDSSTTYATCSPSSACVGNGSARGGWGRGSEDMTHALRARRFRGARLSTPVSAYLREDRNKVNRQSKSENL